MLTPIRWLTPLAASLPVSHVAGHPRTGRKRFHQPSAKGGCRDLDRGNGQRGRRAGRTAGRCLVDRAERDRRAGRRRFTSSSTEIPKVVGQDHRRRQCDGKSARRCGNPGSNPVAATSSKWLAFSAPGFRNIRMFLEPEMVHVLTRSTASRLFPRRTPPRA
jgi:hypothetical protein